MWPMSHPPLDGCLNDERGFPSRPPLHSPSHPAASGKRRSLNGLCSESMAVDITVLSV
jgi:hypothetical protein